MSSNKQKLRQTQLVSVSVFQLFKVRNGAESRVKAKRPRGLGSGSRGSWEQGAGVLIRARRFVGGRIERGPVVRVPHP